MLVSENISWRRGQILMKVIDKQLYTEQPMMVARMWDDSKLANSELSFEIYLDNKALDSSYLGARLVGQASGYHPLT
jgi:hypothetical protein